MTSGSRRCLYLAIALMASFRGVAQPPSSPPPLPQPPDAHSDAGEIPCFQYALDAYLTDKDVQLQLNGNPLAARLPPPCTESVNPAVPTAANKAGDSSISTMKSLFDTSHTPLERLQNGFDLYSWLTFLALNSPDDASSSFGLSSAGTVWERRFFPLDQVIRESDIDTASPQFSRLHLPASCPKPAKGATEPTLFVTVDDVAFDQPFRSGPLIDQHGNFSLNTIFVNSTMRNYINKHKLYVAAGQVDFPERIDFDAGTSAAGEPLALGSIMIKASWRIITPGENLSEFHTVTAYRYLPSKNQCDIQTLGLVGLHIVHKTEGRRQWIWTTFEHVRNVPTRADLANGTKTGYLFYDTSRPPPLSNEPPPQPWNEVVPSTQKSQIVRARDLSDDVKVINSRVHGDLAALSKMPGARKNAFADPNVWLHYQLVSTQWPADFFCAKEQDAQKKLRQANQLPDPACLPAPEFLPNSTLETYIQHDIGTPGGVPQATSSCIACHNNAVGYQHINFGDARSLSHSKIPVPPEDECLKGAPTRACSAASDFTFILEQVCAPMPDLLTGKPDPRFCKHAPEPPLGELH
jgi:hypothetical protein